MVGVCIDDYSWVSTRTIGESLFIIFSISISNSVSDGATNKLVLTVERS